MAVSHRLSMLESAGADGERWRGCSGPCLAEAAGCKPLFSRNG